MVAERYNLSELKWLRENCVVTVFKGHCYTHTLLLSPTDGVVCNAGAMLHRRQLTSEGHEV